MAFCRARVVAKIGASADKVWSELGAFNNLPALLPDVIASSKLDAKGVVRELKIKGQKGTLHERLLKYDSKTRIQSYEIIDEPNNMVPFTSYTAVIKVKPSSARSCTVEWSSRFEPKAGSSAAECRAFAHGVYEAGIGGTKALLGLKRKKR